MNLPGPRELISESSLQERIEELGEEIAEHYRDLGPPLLVCVLKGASMFSADLMRSMPIDVTLDFMSISSYGAPGGSSGVVRILKDLDQDIGGKHVLIVEDIVDTGLTLNYLRKALGSRDPASLRTVTLLDKAVRRIVPVQLEWRGFEIPDVFVLGYGMDHREIYRNLGNLVVADDIAALAATPELYVEALWGAPV